MDKHQFIRDLIADASTVECPACGKRGFWDNRTNKKSENGPDWKCKNKDCAGATPLKKKIPLGVWIPDDFAPMEASQPSEKRIPSPYREPGQRTATVVPGGELPDPPHGGLPPDWTDAPLPEEPEWVTETEAPEPSHPSNDLFMAYTILWAKVAKEQAAIGKQYGFPVDGQSIQSATATLFIEMNRRGLLK